MTWSAKLPRPVRPSNHRPLLTLADARTYMLELPAVVSGRQAWQQAAKLMLEASRAPAGPALRAAAKQLELALFLAGRLDLGAPTPKKGR